MKPAVVLLGLAVLLDTAFGAEESCVGRCGSFNSRNKCQCDSMCVYYGSCCEDFYTFCPKKVSRGDTFGEAEMDPNMSTTEQTPNLITVAPTVPSSLTPPPRAPHGPSPTVDPNAAPCSGLPFDAFLQLKNGSIYAFRGLYFFELDEQSILPGYPKLIEQVWGIAGPVSAAFTRINCQGKSYIFKGNQYWRFDGDVLDEDYPRNISVGFEDIPNDIDAAFAVPAPSHRGREKAYFFKGDKYYQYEFKHQPSHEECVSLSRTSPSVLFTRYTDLFCEQPLENLFTDLFESFYTHNSSPQLMFRDWKGISPPVDAALVGKVSLSPKPTISSPPARRRSRGRRRRPSKRRFPQRRRQSRFVFDDLWFDDDLFDFGVDYSDMAEVATVQEYKSTPFQNVYFFKKDKYYRVSLQTKRVDSVSPPYPRSIAKYWLGCEEEYLIDSSRAEKK
ncbi:PREDICTED: vitronectin-like [Poecilia mexicana]|uniref:SMB domain-containing protein n=1 Tax=Poecilia mexicana TaxID=48701 RepID=A0A3B3YXF1_9TELE|nr:PREDICTED: vitronectin-like [Poecilia mexicana]